MSALELVKTWGYAVALAAFVAFVAFDSLAKRPPAPAASPAPVRTANEPLPGVPEGPVRDPFVTGAEWRARMREKLEPGTAPSAPGTPSAAPRPAGPDFTLMGTMTGRTGSFAELSVGQFRLGESVRGFRIVEIELDRIVVTRGGARFTLRIPGTGPEERR